MQEDVKRLESTNTKMEDNLSKLQVKLLNTDPIRIRIHNTV